MFTLRLARYPRQDVVEDNEFGLAPHSDTSFMTLLAQNGDPFAAVLVDPDGRAGIDFGVSGVPETFLIGADGRIRAKVALPMTPASAEALLDQSGPGR